MWQKLYDELADQNFTIIAVAFDSRAGAARPWVEQARPEYVSLVDPFHFVADLYNMDNVNLGVWIDEQGRIVRPTESAGATEGFRQMNRQTGQIPAAVTDRAAQVKTLYHDALRDWVAKGESSEFWLAEAAAQERLNLPSSQVLKAHTLFRLGQYLIANGNAAEGDRHVAAASKLHPDSWAIWRQGAELNETGLAATETFWTRVEALGNKHYYPPINMPGIT